jgi:hypothetical protein
MILNRIAHLYKITNIKNNEFYIGKHLGNTQGSYWGSGLRIKNYIKKHGKTDLKYEILVIGVEQYIYEIEAAYITKTFMTENKNCLNILTGGLGKHEAKCGSSIGRIASNKGKKASDETRLKLSLAKLGKPSHRKGTKHTPETLEKMRLAKLGKKMPKETGLKIKALHTGRVLTKTECPYCSYQGSGGAMRRWHFDNCKNKEKLVWQQS